MTKRKYPSIAPGQKVEINWRKTDYYMACCDCGLVHKFRFVASGNILRMRAWRDNRRTGILRRKEGITVKHEPREVQA